MVRRLGDAMAPYANYTVEALSGESPRLIYAYQTTLPHSISSKHQSANSLGNLQQAPQHAMAHGSCTVSAVIRREARRVPLLVSVFE